MKFMKSPKGYNYMHILCIQNFYFYVSYALLCLMGKCMKKFKISLFFHYIFFANNKNYEKNIRDSSIDSKHIIIVILIKCEKNSIASHPCAPTIRDIVLL